jgi:hypothetical protein
MKIFVALIFSASLFQLHGMKSEFAESLQQAKRYEFSCDLYSPIELFAIATNLNACNEDQICMVIYGLSDDFILFLCSPYHYSNLSNCPFSYHLKNNKPSPLIHFKKFLEISLEPISFEQCSQLLRANLDIVCMTDDSIVSALLNIGQTEIIVFLLSRLRITQEMLEKIFVRAASDQNIQLFTILKKDIRLQTATPFDLEGLLDQFVDSEILMLILSKLNKKSVYALACINKQLYKTITIHWHPQ